MRKNHILVPAQSGRTMVEIMGALAIMGLLSLASFFGYRIAIDWYRANEITHGIMERSVIIKQQRELEANLSLKEFLIPSQSRRP